MIDRPTFGTLSFYEAVADALNSDPEWRESATAISFSFIFHYEDPFNKSFLLRFNEGEVIETAELASPDAVPVDFVISGPVENYKALISKEISPTTAMATQKLKIQGKQTVLLRYMKKLSRMLDKMTEMDPIFPTE